MGAELVAAVTMTVSGGFYVPGVGALTINLLRKAVGLPEVLDTTQGRPAPISSNEEELVLMSSDEDLLMNLQFAAFPELIRDLTTAIEGAPEEVSFSVDDELDEDGDVPILASAGASSRRVMWISNPLLSRLSERTRAPVRTRQVILDAIALRESVEEKYELTLPLYAHSVSELTGIIEDTPLQTVFMVAPEADQDGDVMVDATLGDDSDYMYIPESLLGRLSGRTRAPSRTHQVILEAIRTRERR